METWKQIPGYPNYEASTQGRIRSVTHYDSIGRLRNGKVKKTKTHKNGYIVVTLNHKDDCLVHRLLAITFLGERFGKEVNHKDGNKANNSLENLEWCTKSENQIHRYRTLHKITESQLTGLIEHNDAKRKIVPDELLHSSMTLKQISAITGISIATIQRQRACTTR